MRNIDDHGHYHGHYHGHNVHNKGLRIPLVAHPRHYPRHGDEDELSGLPDAKAPAPILN